MAKFMKNINLVSRSAEAYREDELKQYGISGCQSKYILYVASHAGASQEEISRNLFINKSNVARQIGLLECDGYIERRENGADRRSALVYPTQKLYDVLPAVKEVHARWRSLITQGMSEGEVELLQQLTEKMVQNAKEYMEGKK